MTHFTNANMASADPSATSHLEIAKTQPETSRKSRKRSLNHLK
jgi:hypothetical protein